MKKHKWKRQDIFSHIKKYNNIFVSRDGIQEFLDDYVFPITEHRENSINNSLSGLAGKLSKNCVNIEIYYNGEKFPKYIKHRLTLDATKRFHRYGIKTLSEVSNYSRNSSEPLCGGYRISKTLKSYYIESKTIE